MGNVASQVAPGSLPQCSANIPLIQDALMKNSDYDNIYSVKVDSVTDLTPAISGSLPPGQTKCSVNITVTSIDTGYSRTDTRDVILGTDSNNKSTIISIGAASSGASRVPYMKGEDVVKYYEQLLSYNKAWIARDWKTANVGANFPYNPPRPSWGDKIFEANVRTYNDAYKALRPTFILTKSSDANLFFKSYLSPVPADPIPPSENTLFVPIDSASGSGAGAGGGNKEDEIDAGIKNASGLLNNQAAYNAFISPSDPDYDPPRAGDSYEQVLLKYNKSFDIITARGLTANSMKEREESGGLDEFDRRLFGRKDKVYRVPDPVLPPTNVPKANRYKGYKFTDRQKYIIDYTPANSSEQEKLRKNFCNSLGFEEFNTKYMGCEEGSDCCAPMPDAPTYQPEGFSGSYKCAGPSLGNRSVTISVPRPPINIDTSNKIYTYKMSKPIGICNPAPSSTSDDLSKLYDAMQPKFIKELQKEIKGDKLFSLRCPASCT